LFVAPLTLGTYPCSTAVNQSERVALRPKRGIDFAGLAKAAKGG